jgi:hypothetical protein
VISFAVLHLGDHNINGGVREFMGNDAFAIMHQEIKEAFLKSDVPEVIRLIDKHFQTHNYSLWHLFKDEQRKVLNQIIEFPLQEIENSFRQIHHHHYPIMQAMNEMRIPLPRSFATPMAFILNIDLCKLLENEELDIDQIQKLIVDIRKWSIEIDQKNLEFVATQRINKLMEKFSQIPNDIQLLENIESILNILDGLFLDLDLGEAQSLCFSIGKQQIYDRMREKSKNGDPTARRWIEHFNNLREYLHVRIT